MVQMYHFYGGKANNPMIVCGVLKSFSTFAAMSRNDSSRHFGKIEALCLSCKLKT